MVFETFDKTVASGMDLCRVIVQKGYEAYLVGGCVRDMIMQRLGMSDKTDIHDVDIATNMPIEQLRHNFKTASNNGEAHGTILVEHDGIYFEVTQFRTDGTYSDGRHPDSVTFTKSFKEDTARRDFTINAMGLDCHGVVIDHHNGIKCLQDKIINTVGDPVERFSEDALRILRAYRFAARYKFDITPEIREAIRKTKYKLADIAMERVSDELKKCMSYGYTEIAAMVRMMNTDGIFQIIDPKGYINPVESENMLSTRAVRFVNGMGSDYTPLGSLICMLWGSDLKNAYQHYKLEHDVFRCAQWCFNHRDTYRNYEKDIVDSVEMVTNKYFPQLYELEDAITGARMPKDVIADLWKIADIAFKDQNILSMVVEAAGYKGKDFGIALHKLKRWYYINVGAGVIENDPAAFKRRASEALAVINNK